MNQTASRLAVVSLLTVAGSAAAAGIFRCDVNGQTTYTDRPCSANSRPAQLPSLQTVPATPAQSGMADDWDRSTAKSKAQRDRADAAWLKRYHARKSRDEAVRKGLIEGRVVAGMTADQVERVLRRVPDRVTGDPRHPKRWIFLNGRGHRTVVTFEHDRVLKVVRRGASDE